MLSKILSGRFTDKAAPAVFPTATGAPPVNVSEPDQGDCATIAALRDKNHRLEARHATERREAFENGYRQGEQSARAELQPVVERLTATINELTALRPEYRRRAERDAVQLALLIARRILHRELAVDENSLNAIARVAFERLTRSESYKVKVHPRFAAAIAAGLPADQASRVVIESDPSTAPGSLVFHCAEGLIDASVDSQLEEITRGLADRLGFKTSEIS